MVIILHGSASDEQLQEVEQLLADNGLRADISRGVEKIVIGAIGATDETRLYLPEQLESLPFVERVMVVSKPYKRVARERNPAGTTVTVGDLRLGENEPQVVVMAGPCSVETREQILEAARAVKAAGATILRGGAFKPRTLPYDFQGLGQQGLEYLAEARRETGLPIVTEVMAPEDVALVGEYTDIFQVGARNMQNFQLLRTLGEARKPVLFKRGMAATLDEYLKATEYILAGGNEEVILCERGIRSFDAEHYRNVFDLNAIAALRSLTHLPICADPSHGTGISELVPVMARAAIAAGADALMIEVHPNPAKARSDGRQALTPPQFAAMMTDLQRIAGAVDRHL
ncbi:MAG: 3-deoxy-7-phosphoheptulonate synthase [Armatimonadetes bacterium]|nr:3-deoxy-7-phosphoheptulonate synthase [Armatimonadota bacterium]